MARNWAAVLVAFACLPGCRWLKPSSDAPRADTPAPPGAPHPGMVPAGPHPTVFAPAPPRKAAPCFEGEPVAAAGPIDLRFVASRERGVAPLSVFFETAGTMAPGARRPFHDLSYCWEFGDPDSGFFATTGLEKNRARGPVAAHVFERPGTYRVTLKARAGSGPVVARETTVTVDDPARVFAGEATVCFSSTGNFDGCPAGAKHERSASLDAVADEVASGRRLLLRRGDTFQSAPVSIDVPGPGAIGAFGAGAPPKVVADAGIFRISGKKGAFSDWRISDIDVVGRTERASIVAIDGGARELLLLRLTGTHIGAGITAPLSVINLLNGGAAGPHDAIDSLAIQECVLDDLVGGKGHNFAFVAAHRLSMLGNRFQDSTGGEHIVRLTWVDRGIVSNNDFGNAPSPRHLLKIHAPKFDEPGVGQGKYTQQLVVSDNVLRGTGGLDWMVTFGAQNGRSDERVRDVIVERNLFLPGPKAQVAIRMGATDATIRNNVFSRGQHAVCVRVEEIGKEPPPERVQLLNNTCFSQSGRGATLLEVGGRVREVTAYNNLVAGPKAGRVVGAAGRLSAEGNNLSTDTPGFANDRPERWEDFALRAESPAVDAGSPSVAGAWDFAGRTCPLDGNGSGTREPDVGAIEFQR